MLCGEERKTEAGKSQVFLSEVCVYWGTRGIVRALIKLSAASNSMWGARKNMVASSGAILDICTNQIIPTFLLPGMSAVQATSCHLIKSLEMIFVKLLMPCI